MAGLLYAGIMPRHARVDLSHASMLRQLASLGSREAVIEARPSEFTPESCVQLIIDNLNVTQEPNVNSYISAERQRLAMRAQEEFDQSAYTHGDAYRYGEADDDDGFV